MADDHGPERKGWNAGWQSSRSHVWAAVAGAWLYEKIGHLADLVTRALSSG